MLNRIIEWLKKTVFSAPANEPPVEMVPEVKYRLLDPVKPEHDRFMADARPSLSIILI